MLGQAAAADEARGRAEAMFRALQGREQELAQLQAAHSQLKVHGYCLYCPSDTVMLYRNNAKQCLIEAKNEVLPVLPSHFLCVHCIANPTCPSLFVTPVC